jgi:hypothetical protein
MNAIAMTTIVNFVTFARSCMVVRTDVLFI